MAPRPELFEFRYRDPRTGKWIRARYRAERHELAARYAECEIIGDPEIQDLDPDARYFNPYVGAPPGTRRPVKEPPKNPPQGPKKDPPEREKFWQIRVVVPGAIWMLLSISAVAQGIRASDQPASVTTRLMGLTIMQVVPFPEQMDGLPGPEVPYPSCYRVGRCSAYDVYRFRDRPNWVTRLAPEAPVDSAAWQASVPYMWVFVPVTPEENIVPKYRMASQVREEHRAVSRPIDGPN